MNITVWTSLIISSYFLQVHLLNVETELVAYAQAQGIAVMAYSPFGPLVSRYGQMFPGPKCDDPLLLPIANKYGKTVPQITLRWLVSILYRY